MKMTLSFQITLVAYGFEISLDVIKRVCLTFRHRFTLKITKIYKIKFLIYKNLEAKNKGLK